MKQQSLAESFEDSRAHLRAVAYRMLGSLSEAEDAVQETWLRLDRSDAKSIANLGGWLTTVVGRVCLDMLRARQSRREESLELLLPDPIVHRVGAGQPEQEVILADSIGIALLIVLETLAPKERLAFVLHDMFAVSFEEIASIVGCSSVAARQLASRARRRVQGADLVPDADLSRQREVVDAFLAAVRGGDFDALLAVLDPDIVVRSDRTARVAHQIQGAQAAAKQALMFRRFADAVQPVLVNGAPGFVSWLPTREPYSVMSFTIKRGKIVAIDVINGPERLARLNTAGHLGSQQSGNC